MTPIYPPKMTPFTPGFSKFSSAMCAKGASGLDDLHSATNEFLGHFVDVVYKYKGDGKNKREETLSYYVCLHCIYFIFIFNYWF